VEKEIGFKKSAAFVLQDLVPVPLDDFVEKDGSFAKGPIY
jgi:hypothetical protein